MVGNFLSGSVGTRGVCEDLAVQLMKRGWRIHTSSSKPGKMTRLADMVGTTWSRRSQYDVAQVDVYSGSAFFWAEAVCWALRRAGKPYILTLHGGHLPEFAATRPKRVRRLLQSANVVTSPSHYLIERMKPYREEIRLLPNPLNLSAYPFRLRKDPKPQLLWLRAFHEIYNPTLAAEVVARVISDVPDAHLLMVGPDKADGSRDATVARAEALNVSNRIEFAGRVPKEEVPLWMDRGEIYLNTTNVDNTPVTVMEAMACGLCIVSTNVGGISYLLEHEQDALLVPPGDPDAMAQAVKRVLVEPGLAERLSSNARQKAEGFDWSVVLPQWERLLTDVMNTGRPSS